MVVQVSVKERQGDARPEGKGVDENKVQKVTGEVCAEKVCVCVWQDGLNCNKEKKKKRTPLIT